MPIERSSQRPPGLPLWDPYWRSVRRLTHVRGMPVIDLTRAHRVGHITEVFVNPETRRIAALQVGPAGEFRQQFVAGAHIRRIGDRAVVIQAADGAAEFGDLEEPEAIDSRTLTGLEVLADNGDQVGYISDVYVSPDSLVVKEYELRTPIWERWLRGRRSISPDQVLLCSRELMIVPAQRSGRARSTWDPDSDSLGNEETLKVMPGGRGDLPSREARTSRSA